MKRAYLAIAVLAAAVLAAADSQAATSPPTGRTVVVCGPWSGAGGREAQHGIALGPGAYERSHGLYWFWTIKPRRCQLVHRHRSPDVHVNWILLQNMRWTVWTKTEAVGSGKFIDMGTYSIGVMLSKPHRACGHVAFTLATFTFSGGHHSTMPLNDWCL